MPHASLAVEFAPNSRLCHRGGFAVDERRPRRRPVVRKQRAVLGVIGHRDERGWTPRSSDD
jgi:hypothetical protein